MATTQHHRLLDDAERDAWVAVAVMMTKLPAALDAQLQRDAGLTQFEYGVLSALSEADEHTLRMSELAVLVTASLSRLSHVVSRLEARGYLRRSRCPGGVGRATNATLTANGHAKVAAAAPGHVETVRALVIDPLNARQLAALTSIGRAICSRLDEGSR